MEFFVTAAKGTEPALRDELRELGFRGVRADRGGVHFAGGREEGWRACLESRVGLRVLTPLATFDAPDQDALYEGVRAVDWRAYLGPHHTLAVAAHARGGALTHTQFVSQRTKDAVVDRLRDELGARPSVDLRDPDLRLFVHLVRDRATLYADLSGESLHKRGYRGTAHEAPLKENLAAAVLRLTGWSRTTPLVDPLCGSGTIAIEAALWSRDIAPGLARTRFGFERWASFGPGERAAVADLRAAVAARAKSVGPPIFGRDLDPDALAAAAQNARAAGATVTWQRAELRDLAPLGPEGCVVTNPPYGARLALDEALVADLPLALAAVRTHLIGVLAGTPALERAAGRRPDKYYDLFNGDIACRLLIYQPAR